MTYREILFKKFDRDMQRHSRLIRFLLVFDQMFNVLLWNGSQDETISSHISRRIDKGTDTWFDRLVCKGLKFIHSKHCIISRGE